MATNLTSSWLAPLSKLVGLVVFLPFGLTYLHLHRKSFLKNEYCFVGPADVAPSPAHVVGGDFDDVAITIVAGRGGIVDDNNGVDNGIRGKRGGAGDDGSGAMIVVRDDDDDGYPYHGIYAPMTTTFPSSSGKKRKGRRNDDGADGREFRQRYSPSDDESSSSWPRKWIGRTRGWPSVTRASAVVSLVPSSGGGGGGGGGDAPTDRVIAFVETDEGGRWCLRSSSSSPSSSAATLAEEEEEVRSWCSDWTTSASAHHPPSGIWTSTYAHETSRLRITCPSPSTTTGSVPSGGGGGGRHKIQNAKQNENLRFVLDRPGTTLLLLLNVGLAFQYWNRRVDPSSVSKQYGRIVVEHEWWRGLSGATAHFEPLHLGFNAMSLRALGGELEGSEGRWYGDTVAFLFYNVALVVFSTMVMMALVYARIRLIQRELDGLPPASPLRGTCEDRLRRLRDTSSVGYSAVLFAWMVVSTMERDRPTCPVPFFSDLCFETHAVPGLPFLRFNVAPVISLFVAQAIMPRVSFMGHLAGIICGFCLHWGVFPSLEVCSPNVLIGGVFLVGLIWSRRVIPVRPLLAAAMDEEGCAEHEDYLRSLLNAENREEVDDDSSHHIPDRNGNGFAGFDPIALGKQRKRERELNEARRKRKTLLSLRNLMGMVTFASLFVFDWNSSLVFSQSVLLAYFVFGTQSSLIVWAYTQSEAENDIILPEKKRSGAIWRGFLMSGVISTVVDSMSFASWLSVPIISATMPVAGLLTVSLFMTFRLAVNLLALVVSSKILHDLGEVGGGIYDHVFSSVINWTRSVADNGVFALQRRSLWTAFEGRGIRLGRRQADVV